MSVKKEHNLDLESSPFYKEFKEINQIIYVKYSKPSEALSMADSDDDDFSQIEGKPKKVIKLGTKSAK